MDSKKLILVLAVVLIIIIIISILSIPRTPEIEKAEPEKVQTANEIQPQITPPTTLSPIPPAGTFIKKVPYRERQLPSSSMAAESQSEEDRYSPSPAITTPGGGGGTEDDYANEPKADIPKKPTPKEVQEMQSKGIILY